jgi:hypothetical protein
MRYCTLYTDFLALQLHEGAIIYPDKNIALNTNSSKALRTQRKYWDLPRNRPNAAGRAWLSIPKST